MKRKKKENIYDLINNFGYKILKEFKEDNCSYMTIENKDGYRATNKTKNILNGNGKFYIVDNNNPNSLYNISLYLKLNNKSFYLCEGNEYVNATIPNLKFHCYICDEDFYSRWRAIMSGHGCGVCHGKQVGIKTSLQYLRPDIACELSKDNIFTALDVTINSHKNTIWICKSCENIWNDTIANRTRKGYGCSRCSSSKGEKEVDY